MQYEAILVDLDGVIRHWKPSDESIETAFSLPAGSIRRAAFSPEIVDLAITGAIADEEWRERIAEKLHCQSSATHAREAVALWTEQPGAIDQKVLSLLKDCESSVKLVLVTNATSRLPRDLQALGVLSRRSQFESGRCEEAIGADLPHCAHASRHGAGTCAIHRRYAEQHCCGYEPWHTQPCVCKPHRVVVFPSSSRSAPCRSALPLPSSGPAYGGPLKSNVRPQKCHLSQQVAAEAEPCMYWPLRLPSCSVSRHATIPAQSLSSLASTQAMRYGQRWCSLAWAFFVREPAH